MQGFSDIICLALCKALALVTFLTYHAPIWIQTNTNMQPCTDAHALTVFLTLSPFIHSLAGVVLPVSPLIAVSPAGTRPSTLSISAADWEPGGMSCLSAEDLVKGFIGFSMPSQSLLVVLSQTGPLKFLSGLHGQTTVRLKRPSKRRIRSLGSDTQRDKTVHFDI